MRKVYTIAMGRSNIPIIFIHSGDSEYLRYTLAQAKISNPNSIVYLIGDDSNNKYEFVEHCDMREYLAEIQELSNVYIHRSPNPYEYELFCFKRWFILRNFIDKMRIQKCLYLDSDVMLYANLCEEELKFSQSDIYLYRALVPHCAYINDSRILNSFCRFVIQTYGDESLFTKIIERVEILRQTEGTLGATNDMVFFRQFSILFPDKVGDVSPIIGNSTYDSNINLPYDFRMEGGIKKIIWIDNHPFGSYIPSDSLIRFNILHFQGGAKVLIKDFLKGELQ
jgi:hypothetical protein